MAINFSAQFIVNEKTSTRVLRLTDTSTGFTLSKGNFIITFPDGTQVANTDFANPQITAPGGNTSVSLITDVDNTVLTGTYVITYVALNTSLNEFTKTETFDFNWEKPAKAIINDSDVVLPEVQFKDLTAYETSGSFAGTLTRNFYTTTPSTSEVGVITKTSVGDILTPINASKYYEGIYLVKSDISVAYTHTSKSWLTVAYTDLLEATFDVREAPTQDELVALMNTYKDQIEAYKSTNPSQYEIMNEQYDLVLALYSHILARYQTSTLDGSKAILDQLLGLLPPTEPYTYKATQMLPFTINFTTSLTGSGTVGTLPKFTGTASIGDSIIKEDAGKIGIGKIPTTVLDVDGTIKGTSIVKDGGTSAQFLKADGSVDANTYLTTGSAAGSYQPLDADLTAIAVLAGAAGILTKVSANTWTLDTTSYQVLDADLTAIAALAGTSGLLRKTSANTWTLDTTSYQVLDADLTAIAALTGTSGILIKTAANTWSLDTATYQLADADLTAIAALSGTAGLLKKTAANTWVLDTSAYLTGITSGQITTALGYTPENAANKGVNNGYAGLDGSGKVPSTQLPSYVDDVLEYANVAALPATGETGKIYITLDTNKIYRWSGSVYVEISSSAAVWGGITGTLANQTDLQNALNAKFDDPTGDTTQYIAGDGSLITFPAVGVAGTLIREVRNTTGATLTKGTVIYISGATGNKPTVSKAIATGDSTSAQTFGLVQADIANNANGNVICAGDITGIDTSAFSEGAQLYLSSTTAGTYTTTKQLAPNHLVYIGVVTRAHPTQGQIEVNIQNGYELYELHDVSITSVANNQGLFYESATNLWKNASIATVLGYTPVSPTQLASKADVLNPVFTDNIYISGTNPRLYFTDTDSNPDYTIFIDSGNFYILNQTSGAYKLLIQETGNISAGVGNSMIATSFIRRGGTSDEFLMADGSVSTGAVFNYPGIGIAVSGGGGWLTSIDDNSVNWNAAYSARISSLTTTGNSGAATLASNVLNIPNYTLAGLGGLPLSGGTLTGPLLGTTASFTGRITANHSSAGDYAAVFYNSSATGEGVIVRGGSSSSNNAFIVQNYNGTTTLFNVLASGDSTFSNNVTANSFIKAGGSSTGFLKADGSVDNRDFATTGNLGSYLPLTGGALQNTASSGYVLSVTNVSETSSSNGLYVNIASGSTGTPFRVDRGGVSLITVNYLGATLFKSTVTANQFIKANGTSSEFLMADGSVSSGALGSYLPLSGGTLTGALSGTSATFSTVLADYAMSISNVQDSSQGLLVRATDNDGDLYLLRLQSSNGATSQTWVDRFTVAKNGAATFSSSVTADGVLYLGGANTVLSSDKPHIFRISQGGLGISANNEGAGNQPIIFYTSGSPRLTIGSTGRVGIGIDSPNRKLEIASGTAVTDGIRITKSSGVASEGMDITYLDSGETTTSFDSLYNSNSAVMRFRMKVSGAPLTAMTILGSGNIGIGTPSPAYKLTVVGDVRGYKLIGGEAGVGAGNYTIFSNDDNVGYIDTVRAVNSGDFQFRFSGTSRVTISTGGNITATAFFESSDKRLKTLIEDNYQAKGIESITAKLYTKNGVPELGYYAQDVQGILPSAVATGADGFLNLSYREVHTAKIARLEKRVQELEAQLNLI